MKNRVLKVLVCALAISAVLALCAVSVFATDPTAGETAITTVTTSMGTILGDLSASNIISVITAALAIAIPLLLVWFAFRFIYGKAKKAFKGKGA